MRHLSLALLLLISSTGCARSLPADTLPKPILPDSGFGHYERQPEFQGGQEGLFRYLTINLHYPDEAKAKHLAGKVFVMFVIDSLGAVSDVKMLKGIGGGCDEEAVRVIAQMPNWIPGKVNDRPVSTRYNLPVYFSEKGQALRAFIQKLLIASEKSLSGSRKRPAPPLQIHGKFYGLYVLSSADEEPLWVLDGRELTPEARATLDPATLKTVTVLRRSEATELYGELGHFGAVLLVSR